MPTPEPPVPTPQLPEPTQAPVPTAPGAPEAGAADGRRQAPAATVPGARTGASSRRVVVELDLRTVLLLGVGVVLLWELVELARTAQGALAAMATGLILALGLDPVVSRLRQRLRCGRTTAVALVALAGGVFLAVLMVFMAPRAVRQAEEFGRELPATLRQLYELPLIGDRLDRGDVATKVEDWAQQLPNQLDTADIAELTRSALHGVVTLLTVALVALAVLLDGEGALRRARRLLPPSQRARADRLGRTAYDVIARYFAGSLLVAVLAGLYTLAVGLVLGVPLAPLAALWVTLTNLIPQVGGFLGGAFFTVLAVSQGLVLGLAALVLFVLWLNVENHVIQPSIVGQAVNLSPPVTILAVLVGGAAAGVPGALIATPLVGTLKGLYLEARGTPTVRPPPAPHRHRAARLLRRLLRRR